jgi:hypothetical protein
MFLIRIVYIERSLLEGTLNREGKNDKIMITMNMEKNLHFIPKLFRMVILSR